MLDRTDWERLQEIHGEMESLLEEAEVLVRRSGDRFAYERAKAYWLTGIENELSGFMTMCGMQETIDALEPSEEEDEVDEEELNDDGSDEPEERRHNASCVHGDCWCKPGSDGT